MIKNANERINGKPDKNKTANPIITEMRINSNSSAYGYQSVFNSFGIILFQSQFPFDAPKYMYGKINTQSDRYG